MVVTLFAATGIVYIVNLSDVINCSKDKLHYYLICQSTADYSSQEVVKLMLSVDAITCTCVKSPSNSFAHELCNVVKVLNHYLV